jgi:hypothetical protein
MASAAGDAEAIPMSMSFPPLPPEQTPTKDSIICRICGKPVSVNTAKADADGKGIHEECYALKVQFEQAARFEQAGREALRPVQGLSDGGDGNAGNSRPWKLIAEEVTREQDPKKMGELVAELNQALDEQKIDGTPKAKPDSKPKPDSK